ncbi:MAG: hypothetical protein ACRDDY_14290 [Clostridium sp.]|uniref:hypothetical protein n=1 Tax=Clostridium sp. TaxID=1506 RepID=UPI003EE4D8F9
MSNEVKGNKVRVNCYVKSEIKEYLDSQCEFYGMSIGSFVSFVLMQHKQQGELSGSIVELSKLMEEMKSIELANSKADV